MRVVDRPQIVEERAMGRALQSRWIGDLRQDVVVMRGRSVVCESLDSID